MGSFPIAAKDGVEEDVGEQRGAHLRASQLAHDLERCGARRLERWPQAHLTLRDERRDGHGRVAMEGAVRKVGPHGEHATDHETSNHEVVVESSERPSARQTGGGEEGNGQKEGANTL